MLTKKETINYRSQDNSYKRSTNATKQEHHQTKKRSKSTYNLQNIARIWHTATNWWCSI